MISVVQKKTLIAYVTKGGVTEEAASVIADVLRDKYGFEVDLINLKKNPSPDIVGYQNVIIGSGVRIQRVYKEALKILEKNDFRDKKVAIFLSSIEGGDPKTHDETVTKYIKRTLEKYSDVEPVAAEAFGGRMKFFRWGTDNRDMQKVSMWAEELGKKLSE